MESGMRKASSSSINPAVINKQAALARMGGDEQILQILGQAFLEDSPPIMEQLHQAIEKQEATGIHFGAHKIKGLAANFDGHATTQVAAQLEARGRAEQTDDLQALWEGLVKEVLRLEQAIQKQILTDEPSA